MRNNNQLYPDYRAEIEVIKKEGVTPELLTKIINKHKPNAEYNKALYDRYRVLAEGVPIFKREPRFQDGEDVINNKVNNDYFSEIVDFKVGYFAGVPVAYSYSDTHEAKEVSADAGDTEAEAEEARDVAAKALSDFVTRNNMFDVDMETTKFASICGYSGRLLYTDTDGNERVMPVAPFETIILSETQEIAEPTYAIRYYVEKDIDNNSFTVAEFYDSERIRFFVKGIEGDFVEQEERELANLYGYCPLQGIANNKELLGDAEKVLELIDDYDRTMSDASNEVESFANAYMVFENVNITDEEVRKAQVSGAIKFYSGAAAVRGYFLTKDSSGALVENHLNRVEENIYRFSKTPNLSDESFGSASGISLKFKLTGLEAKCGMYQAKCITANNYMFKAWASALAKRQIKIDPLQCVQEFKRNFPLDILSEAQAAQAMIAAGLPKRVAFTLAFSSIDDIDYVMQLIEEEVDGIPSLTVDTEEDMEGDTVPDDTVNTGVVPPADQTLAVQEA